ncbi:MAG: choice-of-anchor J domain-containing protein [Bacteroidaceae bacterium]|nr:choice-of-anchor J domain-containing protein [Bacteroidaceae bacterium]
MRQNILYLIIYITLCGGVCSCERMDIPVQDEEGIGKEESTPLPEIGEDDTRDGSLEAPYTVAHVQMLGREGIEITDAWIEGFIVGWISGSHYPAGARFDAMSAGETNLLLADSIYEHDPARCIPVQLPNNSVVRDTLNLQDHEANMRRHVRLKGDITSYFNVTGLKKTDNYKWTSTSALEDELIATSVTGLYEDFSECNVGDTLVTLKNWRTRVRYQPNHWVVGGNMYERYVSICHTDTFTNRPYECWLITPPINLARMKNPYISFTTAYDNWDGKAELMVFIFGEKDPVKLGLLPRLDVLTANPTQCGARQWLPSGEIDLHSFSGIQYIGFRYKGKSTGKDGTTFYIDNIRLVDKK